MSQISSPFDFSKLENILFLFSLQKKDSGLGRMEGWKGRCVCISNFDYRPDSFSMCSYSIGF